MRREHGKRDRPRGQTSAARHERIGPVARLAAEEEAASEDRGTCQVHAYYRHVNPVCHFSLSTITEEA